MHRMLKADLSKKSNGFLRWIPRSGDASHARVGITLKRCSASSTCRVPSLVGREATVSNGWLNRVTNPIVSLRGMLDSHHSGQRADASHRDLSGGLVTKIHMYVSPESVTNLRDKIKEGRLFASLSQHLHLLAVAWEHHGASHFAYGPVGVELIAFNITTKTAMPGGIVKAYDFLWQHHGGAEERELPSQDVDRDDEISPQHDNHRLQDRVDLRWSTMSNTAQADAKLVVVAAPKVVTLHFL
jgi:hypothetical protein